MSELVTGCMGPLMSMDSQKNLAMYPLTQGTRGEGCEGLTIQAFDVRGLLTVLMAGNAGMDGPGTQEAARAIVYDTKTEGRWKRGLA
jgi:hypothetical protein